VGFYGLLDRGIQVSGPRIQSQIIEPLRCRFNVTVACFDMVSEKADGRPACATAQERLSCDIYDAQTQNETAAAVWRMCGAAPSNCSKDHFLTRGRISDPKTYPLIGRTARLRIFWPDCDRWSSELRRIATVSQLIAPPFCPSGRRGMFSPIEWDRVRASSPLAWGWHGA
jgi:hypothetical protein